MIRLVTGIALAAALGACSPTYTPACLGDAENPLAAGALAQPSGVALAPGRLYVANAAAGAPEGDFDYCGSFISVLDPVNGAPLRNPLLPEDLSRERNDRTSRFFSDITYDTARDVLYVAERQRGSVLKIDPDSGRVLGRVAAGHGPYSILYVPGVAAAWPGSEAKTRDVIVVADLGEAGGAGHLWVIDAAEFDFRGARAVDLRRSGRPAGLKYDAAGKLLYVTQFDGVGVAAVNLASLEVERVTEPILNSYTLFVRGLAPVTTASGPQIYFTSESTAYGGVWQADASGQLFDNLVLPVAPFALAQAGEQLVALARNRLYLLDRQPLRLAQTLVIDTPRPARLLVDEANRRAYVTSTEPSAVKIVELP